MNFLKLEGFSALIYIINLDKATDRKKHIEKELLKTDIPFQFVSAIDVTTVNSINHKVVNRYKRNLVPAEIACFLSHIKVKELFLKSNHDFAIILEDDTRLLENFDELVKKAIIQHKSLVKKHQWNVLKLKSHGRKKLFKVKEIDSNYSLYGGSVGITTMASIWSKEGAKRFLEKSLKKEKYIIKMPIDCALQEPWNYNLKIYNIAPAVVEGIDFGSQIRPKKRLKSNFYKRIAYELNKAFPKMLIYLRTKLF